MDNKTAAGNETNSERPEDSAPKYDPHLVPAETAARQEREGDKFMHTPSQEQDQNQELYGKADAQPINTTEGYTVDKEGLINNYAIEPEMYINEPGDLRAKEEQEAAERAQEAANVNDDEEGKLTMEGDSRPKGPGII